MHECVDLLRFIIFLNVITNTHDCISTVTKRKTAQLQKPKAQPVSKGTLAKSKINRKTQKQKLANPTQEKKVKKKSNAQLVEDRLLIGKKPTKTIDEALEKKAKSSLN